MSRTLLRPSGAVHTYTLSRTLAMRRGRWALAGARAYYVSPSLENEIGYLDQRRCTAEKPADAGVKGEEGGCATLPQSSGEKPNL
ncbi:hypothetical protein MTO96_012925 [Rhipicephalus appendiculatus]